MAYWLLKSEPSSYSWDQLMADGQTHWDGVRNAQALNNLRAMKLGDRVFFYHSNEGKEIVGVAEVVRTFYPDPADKSGMVDIKPVMPVATPVGLKAMRANPELSDLSLLKQSRLSVCPISEREWSTLCTMMGIPADNEAAKSI